MRGVDAREVSPALPVEGGVRRDLPLRDDQAEAVKVQDGFPVVHRVLDDVEPVHEQLAADEVAETLADVVEQLLFGLFDGDQMRLFVLGRLEGRDCILSRELTESLANRSVYLTYRRIPLSSKVLLDIFLTNGLVDQVESSINLEEYAGRVRDEVLQCAIYEPARRFRHGLPDLPDRNSLTDGVSRQRQRNVALELGEVTRVRLVLPGKYEFPVLGAVSNHELELAYVDREPFQEGDLEDRGDVGIAALDRLEQRLPDRTRRHVAVRSQYLDHVHESRMKHVVAQRRQPGDVEVLGSFEELVQHELRYGQQRERVQVPAPVIEQVLLAHLQMGVDDRLEQVLESDDLLPAERDGLRLLAQVYFLVPAEVDDGEQCIRGVLNSL